MKVIFLIMLLVLSSEAYSIDSTKCSKMLNQGLYKTYKYGGIGEAYWQALTQGTKKDGPSKVSSESTTTEPTSTTFDPKYTSNVWTSETQSTSSWGDCSMFAISEQLRKDRSRYIAQNWDELKIEIARGEGEHLKVVTFYSACEQKAYPKISSYLRGHLDHYLDDEQDALKDVVTDIDQVIKQNLKLQGSCHTI